MAALNFSAKLDPFWNANDRNLKKIVTLDDDRDFCSQADRGHGSTRNVRSQFSRAEMSNVRWDETNATKLVFLLTRSIVAVLKMLPVIFSQTSKHS